MAKKKNVIIFRVEAEAKSRLEQAARIKGLTLTTFVLRAAEREAKAIESRAVGRAPGSARRGGRSPAGGAFPTYFRALCEEARRGGDEGYAAAGHELTRHLPELVDGDSPAKVEAKLAELKELIRGRDDPNVIAWFKRVLPRCIDLVPIRRHRTFLRGVYSMYDKDVSVLDY
jgi:hypothetical protein